METLKLVKLSESSPKKEGYYFVILHNSLKECLWWNEKEGFISRNADEHGVYGWYDEGSDFDLEKEYLRRFEQIHWAFGEQCFNASREIDEEKFEKDEYYVCPDEKYPDFNSYKAHLLTQSEK